MTEKELQDLVLECARVHGVLAYHTHDSRRSEPGFPDLVLVGRQDVLYRELKSETGHVSPEQRKWLDALHDAGENVELWYPRHWPDVIVPQLRALGRVRVDLPEPSQAEIRRKLQRATRQENK